LSFSLSKEPGTKFDTNNSPIKTSVSFIPANDNEFVAINVTSLSGDKQFNIPTYSKKKENAIKKIPAPSKTPEKDMDDYIFQFYVGSISVIGLLLLFRVIQKN
jgi:hypothetical protein